MDNFNKAFSELYRAITGHSFENDVINGQYTGQRQDLNELYEAFLELSNLHIMGNDEINKKEKLQLLLTRIYELLDQIELNV